MHTFIYFVSKDVLYLNMWIQRSLNLTFMNGANLFYYYLMKQSFIP